MKYGRKFWLAAAALATFTGLLIGGYLDQAGYVSLVTIVLTSYLAANVVQKATAKKEAS